MSHISDLDHLKLDATVFPDCVVEVHRISDTTRGLRKVAVTKIWRIERLLSRGYFGDVQLQVQDRDLEAKRVVKVFPRSGEMSSVECETELIALFQFTKPKYKDEAVFVQFFGWFQTEDAIHLAMEYIPLGNLENNLKELEKASHQREGSNSNARSVLAEEEVKDITIQILEGINIMHGEGFAHRDLKPQNILVVQREPQWWIKLANFGLSKRITEETALQSQVGTQSYMAPEMFHYVSGQNPDSLECANAADIWALGCITHRILTGRPPFTDLWSLKMYCNNPQLQEIPYTRSGASHLLRGLLTPHPEQRLVASAALEHPWLRMASYSNVIATCQTNHADTRPTPSEARIDARSVFTDNTPSVFSNQTVAPSPNCSSPSHKVDSHAGFRSYNSTPEIQNQTLSPPKDRRPITDPQRIMDPIPGSVEVRQFDSLSLGEEDTKPTNDEYQKPEIKVVEPEPIPGRKSPEMEPEYRLVIAIDYGVKYTCVATALPHTFNASLSEINVVCDWGPIIGNGDKIPSVISYSPASAPEEQQWGASLSEDAVAIVDTKLELDVQDNDSGELNLILKLLKSVANLDSNYTARLLNYTWKAPESILTDFLYHLLQNLLRLDALLSSRLREITPVDVAVTVPATWSYKGKNSILRAVRKAGFNNQIFPNLKDIIIVTEQDATAIYTLQCIKEETGREILKQGERFVLCDAGDERVDIVLYKVTQLEPILELELLELTTVNECGSVYIDGSFKRWLRSLLGDSNYQQLDRYNGEQGFNTDVNEGCGMKEVMREFRMYRQIFGKDSREFDIHLPGRLSNLSINDKINEGQVTITYEEMQSFFGPFVTRTVEPIISQINRIGEESRVQNLFLVGSFGELQYLQRALNSSLIHRGIQLRKLESDTPGTAAVRGATIYGVEKYSHKNLTIAKTCSRSYGVMFDQPYSESNHNCSRRDPVTNEVIVNGQLTWLIQKGDLLLPDGKIVVEKEFAFNFRQTDDMMFKLPIYEYPHDGIPEKFGTTLEESKKVSVLDCDFSKFPIHKFQNSSNEHPYYLARCRCVLVLFGSILTVSIMWNDVQICSETILEGQIAATSNILVDLSRGTTFPEDIEMLDQLERDDRFNEMTPEAFSRLRELIRARCELDMEIWTAMKETAWDRRIVGRKMEVADAMLSKIIRIVRAWEPTKEIWSKGEWSLLAEVCRSLQPEGKKWWMGNPFSVK